MSMECHAPRWFSAGVIEPRRGKQILTWRDLASGQTSCQLRGVPIQVPVRIQWLCKNE